MTLLDRIKPEVLQAIKDKIQEYPISIEQIINNLNKHDTWAYLPYITVMDILQYSGEEFIRDCFIEMSEYKVNKIKQHEN